jgi:hypothetical protein
LLKVAMRPASYSLPDDIRATLLRALAYMGGLGVLAIVAAGVFQAPSAVIAIAFDPEPQPQWINVERPHPAFELALPELAAGATNYAILRRPADGARKDVMTWGEAADSRPYVMVEIYRPGLREERFLDPSSEIAARIVDFAVTDDVKAAGAIESKFGTVALVDFAIAQQGNEHRCLGFARVFAAPEMQIAGWYCSAGSEIVDRSTLACAIDRLSVLSAGGDRRLDILFARAELKRTFCGERSPILAATPERAMPLALLRNVKVHTARLRRHVPTR